jgi:probable HAF family extracellular repeat protein
VGGSFTLLDGQGRSCLGRLTPTEPATQTLSYDGSTVTWLRGGSSPEVWRTIFDASTNGTDWVALGAGTRIAGGWQLDGLAESSSAMLRGRGFVTGGRFNDSGWFVETILRPPPISRPGGPYEVQCVGTATLVQLDGRSSSSAPGTQPIYTWTTDYPGAIFDDPTNSTPRLLFAGSVGQSCTVTLAVTDGQATNTAQTIVTVVGTLPPPTAAQPPRYNALDIGSLGGALTAGTSLNDLGQVVGYAAAPVSQANHAFLYSRGSILDLNPASSAFSLAESINNLGQVTGQFSPPGASKTFIYTRGSLVDIGTLGGTSSTGCGINNLGQVVGTSTTSGNTTQPAFLYSGGGMRSLGTLGGKYGCANAINDAGLVAGVSELTPGGLRHAFLYSAGKMVDLGTLGGSTSYGYAINASGEVAGGAKLAGDTVSHAFLYTGGRMQDLGTPGGNANAHRISTMLDRSLVWAKMTTPTC